MPTREEIRAIKLAFRGYLDETKHVPTIAYRQNWIVFCKHLRLSLKQATGETPEEPPSE